MKLASLKNKSDFDFIFEKNKLKINSDRFGNENISLRGRGSVQAAGDEVLWDIDGVTFQSPPMLSVNQVVYVEVIKGLSATNKYGSDGAAGVIIVKTSVNASNYSDTFSVKPRVQDINGPTMLEIEDRSHFVGVISCQFSANA